MRVLCIRGVKRNYQAIFKAEKMKDLDHKEKTLYLSEMLSEYDLEKVSKEQTTRITY